MRGIMETTKNPTSMSDECWNGRHERCKRKGCDCECHDKEPDSSFDKDYRRAVPKR